MSTRRRALLVAASLVIIAVSLTSLGNERRVEQVIVPDAPYPGEPSDMPCDDACATFVAAISPSLRILVAEGNALAVLGTARSRDILELTIRMDRFQDSARTFAEKVESHPPPEWLQPTVIEITASIERAQLAIDDAISALRSFRWDELGAAVTAFDTEMKSLVVLADELPIASQHK